MQAKYTELLWITSHIGCTILTPTRPHCHWVTGSWWRSSFHGHKPSNRRRTSQNPEGKWVSMLIDRSLGEFSTVDRRVVRMEGFHEKKFGDILNPCDFTICALATAQTWNWTSPSVARDWKRECDAKQRHHGQSKGPPMRRPRRNQCDGANKRWLNDSRKAERLRYQTR